MKRTMKLRLIFILIAFVYVFSVAAVYGSESMGVPESNGVSTGVSESSAEDMLDSQKGAPVGVPAGSSENILEKQSGVDMNQMKIFKYDGKEMFKLIDLAEKYNWVVYFNPASRVITINNENKSYTIDVDQEQQSDLALIKGRTYLSIDLTGKVFDKVGEETTLISGLYTDKEVYKHSETITAHIRAYNFSNEPVELDFSSGQRYDLYIKKDNTEIWRWSDGRFFTMALARKEIKPDESLAYDVEIDANLKEGRYTLSGELATIRNPIKLNDVGLVIE